jgi:hypothetical protein
MSRDWPDAKSPARLTATASVSAEWTRKSPGPVPPNFSDDPFQRSIGPVPAPDATRLRASWEPVTSGRRHRSSEPHCCAHPYLALHRPKDEAPPLGSSPVQQRPHDHQDRRDVQEVRTKRKDRAPSRCKSPRYRGAPAGGPYADHCATVSRPVPGSSNGWLRSHRQWPLSDARVGSPQPG